MLVAAAADIQQDMLVVVELVMQQVVTAVVVVAGIMQVMAREVMVLMAVIVREIEAEIAGIEVGATVVTAVVEATAGAGAVMDLECRGALVGVAWA